MRRPPPGREDARWILPYRARGGASDRESTARCAGIGSVTVTMVPVPTVESTATLPANMLRTTLCTTPSPYPAPFAEGLGREAGLEDPVQVLGADARSLVPHAQPQGVPHLRQPDANGCRPGGALVGGVADQVDQQVVERIGVALQIHDFERGVEFERNLLFLKHATLERAAGADHADGVEPLRPRQGAARPILDRPQEARRAVDIFHHLAELVEQLEPPAGGDLRPAPERLHREVQASARRRQGIRQLV